MIFQDRREAGEELGSALKSRLFTGGETPADSDILVLGLPRGGVPVAYEVARALDAELDVFLVRKLGVPGHEELAMGAIASGGVRILNEEVVWTLRVSEDEIEYVAQREQAELERRERLYRGDLPPPAVSGRTVILVDDGLATGSTMRAALTALRRKDPAREIVAVPVGAWETCAEFRNEADDVVCARVPDPFYAVGLWYRDFSQTTDEEVRELLERAAKSYRGRKGAGAAAPG